MSTMKGRIANVQKEMIRTGEKISKKKSRETEKLRYMAKDKF